MSLRLNYVKAAPDAYRAVATLSHYVDQSGLEPSLLHLIKLRASQMNGCAYCVDMHVKEAKRDGEHDQRLHLVCVWRESSLFSEREQAALAWTEALTLISQTGAPDTDYQMLEKHFTEEEMTKLTVAIGTINLWNRLAVGFRSAHPVDPLE